MAFGVDELSGGCGFCYERVMRLANDGVRRVDDYVLGAHPNDYVPSESGLFGEKLCNLKIDWAALLPYFDNNLAIADQIFLADYNAKCRQNSMPLARLADSLGVRVFYPWLDDRFIDFSCVSRLNGGLIQRPAKRKHSPQELAEVWCLAQRWRRGNKGSVRPPEKSTKDFCRRLRILCLTA